MQDLAGPIESLGRGVAVALGRANGDLRTLPEIAESALEDFSALDGVDLATLVDFLEQTNLRQQAKNPFSDLPLTVWHSRDFYIELLVWSHATTAIHQHGFGGAFRVVRGSSIHTRYSFQPEQRVTDDCLVGEVASQFSECLATGAVRRIDPGVDGLIHSLYHLENPSVSLIVRDRGHAAFGPQYSYYPPRLALHRRALEADDLVAMFMRLVNLASQLDRAFFLELWIDRIAQFEFPRMAWLYMRFHGQLNETERKNFRRSAEAVHGGLVHHLFESAEEFENQHLLARMRERVHDSELRFFLALLMNVPERTDLLRMVRERFPERDASECCADWLARLSVDQQSAVDRMTEVAQMIEISGRGSMQFSRRLRKALPRAVEFEQARAVFKSYIEGEARDSDSSGGSPCSAELAVALRQLSELPQLAVFNQSRAHTEME